MDFNFINSWADLTAPPLPRTSRFQHSHRHTHKTTHFEFEHHSVWFTHTASASHRPLTLCTCLRSGAVGFSVRIRGDSSARLRRHPPLAACSFLWKNNTLAGSLLASWNSHYRRRHDPRHPRHLVKIGPHAVLAWSAFSGTPMAKGDGRGLGSFGRKANSQLALSSSNFKVERAAATWSV